MVSIGSVAVSIIAALAFVQAQAPPKPFEPTVGMAGKDVVWVPTDMPVVEKMLDMAKITPQDVMMDLGSGDGRMVIAAAKRGARAVGVEYNPDMVNLSRQHAKQAGVDGKASFIEGDMYEADISQASVLSLFLLTTNLDKLKDKFLALKPGSRIVLNTFRITDWEPDEELQVQDNCTTWCTVLLHIVPARVAGTWRLGNGDLRLTQQFQKVSGELTTAGKTTTVSGHLKGEEIVLTIGGVEHTGRVTGNSMTGTSGPQRQAWTAARK